jgi:taurine dioxygenase
MQVKNLTDTDFVAEIYDFSVDDVTLEGVRRRLQYLWAKHQVLVFRGLDTQNEARLIEVSKVFGKLEIHSRHEYLSPEVPELLYVSNMKDGDRKIGILGDGEAGWHSDQTYRPSPAIGSLLAAAVIPPTGGETSFADMYRAYDDLALDLKSQLDRLRAVQSYEHFNQQYSEPANAGQKKVGIIQSHPAVRTHPITGRRAIYVAKSIVPHFEGMSTAESQPLLEKLHEHCFQAKYVYKHKWSVGDGVLWDNACVMHRREAFNPLYNRLMKRTTIRPPEDLAVPF